MCSLDATRWLQGQCIVSNPSAEDIENMLREIWDDPDFVKEVEKNEAEVRAIIEQLRAKDNDELVPISRNKA